jgi:hypothetical protein
MPSVSPCDGWTMKPPPGAMSSSTRSTSFSPCEGCCTVGWFTPPVIAAAQEALDGSGNPRQACPAQPGGQLIVVAREQIRDAGSEQPL